MEIKNIAYNRISSIKTELIESKFNIVKNQILDAMDKAGAQSMAKDIVFQSINVFKSSALMNAADKIEENIRKGFQERLGGDIIVRFDYPEVIKTENSGKFRYVVSKVAEKYI